MNILFQDQLIKRFKSGVFVSKTEIAVYADTAKLACLVITSDSKFFFSVSGKFLIKWDLIMGNELWRFNNLHFH